MRVLSHLFGRVSFRDRLGFYETMASKVERGVPLPRALEMAYNSASRDGERESWLSRLYLSWQHQVGGEASGRVRLLAEATEGALPDLERQFVRIGEVGRSASEATTNDSLARGLRSAARYAIALNELKKVALKAWITPTLSFATAAFSIGLSAWSANMQVENFSQMFHGRLPAFVGFYAGLCAWLVHWGLVVPFGAAVVALVAWWSLPRWTGAVRHWFDLHLPVYAQYRRLQGVQALIGVAYLIACDATPAGAVGALLDTASDWLRSYLDPVYRHLTQESGSLPMALWEAGGQFPDEHICRSLRDFDDSGKFAEDAVKTLDRETDRALDSIKLQIQGLAFTILAMMLAILAFFFIADLAFELSLNTSVQTIQQI